MGQLVEQINKGTASTIIDLLHGLSLIVVHSKETDCSILLLENETKLFI